MKIGNVDLDHETLIVAEIGNNHEGRFEIAEQLVLRAAECGVQAVKFQTFNTEHYVSQSDGVRFKRLKSFELRRSEFQELARLTKSLGLLFISTPFDLESARFLEPIVDGFKIASGDNNFYPLIEHVARSEKPLIVSTGASDHVQVRCVIEFVKHHRARCEELQLAILHCVSSYPVPTEQLNLRSIAFLKEAFGLPVGYSDHATDPDAALIAVVLGARIIEKHFTLDKGFSDFRDHQLSADPTEMRQLVQRIKGVALMLGTYGKRVQSCEEGIAKNIRRSIVAGANLDLGHTIQLSDLTWIRPAGGLQPGQEHRLLGKKLMRRVSFGEILLESDVE